MFYKESFVQEPNEKTGFDGNLWKWEYPNYTKSYMVVRNDVVVGIQAVIQFVMLLI